MEQTKPSPWSEREIHVVQLAARGMTNDKIAARLGISVNTVKSRLFELSRRTGISGRYMLAREAQRLGYLDPYQACEDPARERQRLAMLIDGLLADAPLVQRRLDELALVRVVNEKHGTWARTTTAVLARVKNLLEDVDGLE